MLSSNKFRLSNFVQKYLKNIEFSQLRWKKCYGGEKACLSGRRRDAAKLFNRGHSRQTQRAGSASQRKHILGWGRSCSVNQAEIPCSRKRRRQSGTTSWKKQALIWQQRLLGIPGGMGGECWRSWSFSCLNGCCFHEWAIPNNPFEELVQWNLSVDVKLQRSRAGWGRGSRIQTVQCGEPRPGSAARDVSHWYWSYF